MDAKKGEDETQYRHVAKVSVLESRIMITVALDKIEHYWHQYFIQYCLNYVLCGYQQKFIKC